MRKAYTYWSRIQGLSLIIATFLVLSPMVSGKTLRERDRSPLNPSREIQIRHNMAFLSKVGRIFRQTSTHVTASNSMLQSIRCMSSSKIFVGGISYSTDEFGLREAFSKYGEVVDAKIIVDRETGRSRGFAFVTFTSTEEASNAMQLDGQDLHGRRIRVNYATERGSGFGGRGFGGPGGGYGAAGGGYGGGGAGGYGAPAGGYGGGSYGGNAGAYGGNSPYGGNAGGDGYGSNFGGGYGVAGGVGGSDNFAQGSSSSAGFDDKFSSDVPLGNDTDHQLESAGDDNQFGGSENGQSEVGPDGFDQTDDGDVAKRA